MMKVTLMAKPQLAKEFTQMLENQAGLNDAVGLLGSATDNEVIALTAIRNCYSYRKPSEIMQAEGKKYFSGKGKEANRLFNHIISSGHTSTLEHINFTFLIEDVSRALLAQLTRHRVGWSYSVKSQRYVKLSSDSRSGGFDYVTPDNLSESQTEIFKEIMKQAQQSYDFLVELGVPQEDARAVLPNATTTDLVVTCNLRALADFCNKRDANKGAQSEIAKLAWLMKNKVSNAEPMLSGIFEEEE